ncbi:MAG: undecaprenyl-phosphate glucose phosphotransferase [Anaerolineaceae bacterium 4572_78]|nr:MAG: undecaprenyl-phosphate glucose phosphotransferase [Anaerolineaceae bacterium 4572_78]
MTQKLHHTSDNILSNLKQRAPSLFKGVLVVSDAVMTGLAFYVAYRLRLQTEYIDISDQFSTYWGMAGTQIACVITIFFFYRLYHKRRSLSHLDEFYHVFGAASVATVMAFAFISFIYKNHLDYPRLMMVYVWILTILFTILGRVLHARVRWFLQAKGWGESRVLIVGTGDVGRVILQRILHSPELGYRVVGMISYYNTIESVLNVPVIGDTENISHLIKEYHVDEVIIGIPEISQKKILNIIADCEREHVAIKIFPDVFQIMATEVSIDDLNGLPLLSVRDIALRGWKLSVKRGMDVIFSSLFLVFTSPMMMVVALLIKLDSEGSVFYIQERMGLDGKPFQMIKFRSMRENAEDKSGPVWTTEDDKRKTELGEFIRRFSIDETPQFINVIIGEMSIVGPRPERPVFVEKFRKSIPRYMERHREKAGITGWAQVNGLRGNTSIIERTKYDLWYIENWSIWLDIKIMLKTAVNVFIDRNAY